MTKQFIQKLNKYCIFINLILSANSETVKSVFHFYKKRNQGVLNFLKLQKNMNNGCVIGDLFDPPRVPQTAR